MMEQTKPAPKKKKINWVIWLLVLAAIAVGIWYFFFK